MQPVACVGDTVFCAADIHVVPPGPPPPVPPATVAMPFPVSGNITQGSSGSMANNKPIARKGDKGVHAACPGSNTFVVDDGSTIVFDAFDNVNKAVARVGDPTLHCGDDISHMTSPKGTILTGAFTILAD